MRLLNTPERPKGRWFPTDKPERAEIDAFGHRVLLDVNTLAAAVPPAGEEGESFGEAVKPQFMPHARTPVKRLVLNVTHACNLACRYCFAADYERLPSMTVDTARRAIDGLFAPQHDLMISFFGGEPLMAWDVVNSVMDYAESLAAARRVRAGFHITTNGVLLTEEKVAALAQRNCSLLVSLDGAADLHNTARPAKDTHIDSHAAVMRALAVLHTGGLSRRVTARATYAMPAPRLAERLAFFTDLQERGLVAGFSIEPAVMAEGCSGRAEDAFDAASIEHEYAEAARSYLDHLRNGRPPNFFHFRKILSRLVHRRIAGSECGAGCGYLTIGPDGGVFACHREAGTRVGHVDTGIDEGLRAPWCDNRLYRCAECRSCWARHVCGGGCRQILAERGCALTEAYGPRCLVMKTIIRACLWIMAEAGPALLRRVT